MYTRYVVFVMTDYNNGEQNTLLPTALNALQQFEASRTYFETLAEVEKYLNATSFIPKNQQEKRVIVAFNSPVRSYPETRFGNTNFDELDADRLNPIARKLKAQDIKEIYDHNLQPIGGIAETNMRESMQVLTQAKPRLPHTALAVIGSFLFQVPPKDAANIVTETADTRQVALVKILSPFTAWESNPTYGDFAKQQKEILAASLIKVLFSPEKDQADLLPFTQQCLHGFQARLDDYLKEKGLSTQRTPRFTKGYASPYQKLLGLAEKVNQLIEQYAQKTLRQPLRLHAH